MFTQPQQQRALGRVIARAWSDPLFKEQLKANPKDILNTMGMDVPEGLEIEVVENSPSKIYLTLPAVTLPELIDDEDIEANVDMPSVGPPLSSAAMCCSACSSPC
jgi:hypothetical protein